MSNISASEPLSDRRRIEDWGQTLGLALIAATVPVLVGSAIAASLPALGISPPIERSEARIIAAWAVLAISPIVVYFLARKAASLTSGSRMLRASLVGLAPGMLVLSFGVRAALTDIPGPPVTAPAWVAWTAINWLPALLAAARSRRTGATPPSNVPSRKRTSGTESREER